MKLEFKSNPAPTVGVEIEVGLVDARTMALRPAIREVLAALPADRSEGVKPELMQCYLEVNSGVCHTIPEVREDLLGRFQAVEAAADREGLRLLWSGTHPFSLWKDQVITPNERYEGLVNLLQDMARQLVTFGLHVHVGVDSGDKAIMICDRILPYLPLLLALSANSPCWENRLTGLQSSRSKVMEGLPTAGLPVEMRNWSEYTWLINHLVETGFINTIREIWWDVRPHHNFGTVEVRVCDVPGTLDDAMALAALAQCLVHTLSQEIDSGSYLRSYHPMMVRQNKWRAARYGVGARLVDFETYEARPVRQLTEDLARRLRPAAEELGCLEHLGRARELAAGPSWAERQAALIAAEGPVEAVRRLTGLSRLS